MVNPSNYQRKKPSNENGVVWADRGDKQDISSNMQDAKKKDRRSTVLFNSMQQQSLIQDKKFEIKEKSNALEEFKKSKGKIVGNDKTVSFQHFWKNK